MKKVLFIYSKRRLKGRNRSLHIDWVDDCKNDVIVKFWGQGFGNQSKKGLLKVITSFNPDYIYLTIRKRYEGWLFDLTSIKVPKIFVEVDTWNYNAKDLWYKQFDHVYCRSPIWKTQFASYNKMMPSEKQFHRRIRNLESWKDVPQLRWSISKKHICRNPNINRKKVYFIGKYTSQTGLYEDRRFMKKTMSDVITCFQRLQYKKYFNLLKSAKALICPTETGLGHFVPGKIFEYAASGAAILTNCDFDLINMPEIEGFVIRYENLEDLRYKIKNVDFSKYYGALVPLMLENTHSKRYKKLFI